jgi:Xaa-Pro aminopeptidase
MTPQEYQARIARAQALMGQAGFDAVLLATGPNLFYFTGFPSGRSGARPYILILPQSGAPIFIVHQARQYEVRQFTHLNDIRLYSQLSRAPIELISQVLVEKDLQQVGLELSQEHYLDLQVADWQQLETACPHLKFVDAAELLWQLRLVKSDLEIQALRRACRITELAYDQVYSQIRAGMTEAEIERRMLMAMISLGGQSPWVLITSGEGYYDLVSKGGSERPIAPGDMVWMDAGCAVAGYYSDFSRAGVVGGPTEAQQQLQQRIHEITLAGLALVRPGVDAAAIARSCHHELAQLDLPITSNISGLAGRVGHGLGLAMIEWPSINLESQITLQAGMVITVEPGVATTFGTFHVEENVLVTETGYELLSPCSWELRNL